MFHIFVSSSLEQTKSFFFVSYYFFSSFFASRHFYSRRSLQIYKLSLVWVRCAAAVVVSFKCYFSSDFLSFPSFSFYCLMNLEEERILRSNVHFHSAGLLVWWSLSSSTHSRSSSQVRCHIVCRPSGIWNISHQIGYRSSLLRWRFRYVSNTEYSNNNITVLVVIPPDLLFGKAKIFFQYQERVEKWVFKCVQNVCAQIKWIVIYLASVEWAKNIKEWTTFIAYINMMLLLMLHRCRCCFHEKQTKLNEI